MAQAILLADVEGLGENGTAVEVSPGYLRNFLQPRGLAQPATPGALEEAIRRKEAAEKAEREAIARAKENASLLSKTVLTINHRAGDDGKLYGSVTTKEIENEVKKAGLAVDRKKMHLAEPLKALGTFEIPVKLMADVTATLKVEVVKK